MSINCSVDCAFESRTEIARSKTVEYEYDDAQTKQAALKSARRKIIVADSTKIGAVSFVRLCHIGDVDILVTDTAAPAESVATIRAAGVDVLLA